MEISKVEHFETIIDDIQIRTLFESIIFNPSYGKIQNIAQSTYAKTQGRFYTAKEQDRVIGFMGFSKIDNHKLIVRHFAVLDQDQKKTVGKALLDHAISEENVAIISAEVEETAAVFYKAYGFSTKKMPYDDARGQLVLCTFDVK